ncbi:hypothetical protein B0H16DRAFT_1731375 [Mycena metata]|uniref:CCHC-type domain-containing protein n=1 Tax=Mycena metata TaxID=1033252 RepID=A0AAD7I557_9AGAR|nr:hypothetical protein B0H16DRAFT_1731375 [Mycena metata]
MSIRGSKDAPKTFRGKYTDVQRWVDHYEQLVNKCRITDDQEKEDYNAYFLIGIQRPLRQILENRIMQASPYRHDEAQYTIREINEAVEWYFRCNWYESLMVRAADLGEELNDDFSGNESDIEASGSDDEESDYEEFLRKKKQRAKKKKQERTKKVTARKVISDKGTQKFHGNEEEVAGMIRKLNAMRLDDPEYAPIFYKVMVMDQTGTAGKCVKPPITDRGETARVQPSRAPMPRPVLDFRPPNPTSYPNNIPLGPANTGSTNPPPPGCFGCDESGHRISECRRVQELLANGVLARGDDGQRLVMGNGGWIRKNTGELLVSATERIAAANTPRVMLNYVDEFPGYESYNGVLLMSLSHQPTNQLPFSPPTEAYQYLSRLSFSEPPVPVVRISAAGPVETVVDAVSRQWQKVANNQPMDVDPTFCAAPQSEYYSSVTLPNSQELHRSSAQNAWSLELVYPNDARLHDAMSGMSPLDSADEVGFPVHAMLQELPMVPMAERLRLPLDALATDVPVRCLEEERGVRPEETQQDRSARCSREAELNVDIERRTLLSLSLDDDDEAFHNTSMERATRDQQVYESPFSDSYDDLPDLQYASDSDSSDSMGVCGFWFEHEHRSTRNCPLFGLKTRAMYDASEPGDAAQSEVEDGASGGSEELFSLELRRVLEVAVGPIVRELMGVPLGEARAFRSMETVVKRARAAFNMYTNDTALCLADMREQNRLQLERDEFENPLDRQIIDGSGIGQIAEGLGEGESTLAMQVQVRMNEERQRKADDPNYIGSFSPLDGHTATSSSDSLLIDSCLADSGPLSASSLRCGPLITRDEWSSSDSATSDLYSHSYDEVSIPSFSGLSEHIITLDHESWTPAGSVWSVELFSANPTWIIDDALARMRARSSAGDESSAEYPASSRNSSSMGRYWATSVTDDPPRVTIPTELQEVLVEWEEMRSFPAFFTHHPLLHDIEAAKLQVLAHLLQRQGCEGPATLLYEILAVRLRDEYAISHLLNAGYLGNNFPEEMSHYWELMGGPIDGDDARSESSVNMVIPPFMYPYLTAERPPTGINDSLIDPALFRDASPSPGPLLYPTNEEIAERAAHATEAQATNPAPALIEYIAPISMPLPEFLR